MPGKMTLLIAMALAFISSPAFGSIVVNDLSQNVSGGVYTYTLQFDSATNVAAGDGFVIYDFPDFTSFIITGDLSTSQFTESSTALSNTLTRPTSVDSAADIARTINGLPTDNSSINNLTFSYKGTPVPFTGAATATLTINTTDLSGPPSISMFASIDHSGPSSSFPFALAENPISVPNIPAAITPVPESACLAGFCGTLLLMRRRNKAA